MKEQFKKTKQYRLQQYDYSQGGYYFVTICTKNRKPWLGKLSDKGVQLSDIGHATKKEWVKTAEIRQNVWLDEFNILQDHIHGILIIEDDEIRENRPTACSYAIWAYSASLFVLHCQSVQRSGDSMVSR